MSDKEPTVNEIQRPTFLDGEVESLPTVSHLIGYEYSFAGLRQNERMPRYVQPDKPIPEWAVQMSGILGIPPLRLEILRHLYQNPDGGTSGEVARALGPTIGYKTVLRHLQQLEALGAVTARLDDNQARQGQHVVFQLSTSAWTGALKGLKSYVEGT